jgi:RNA polymerase sigma-70 factor (ECF subfamily)
MQFWRHTYTNAIDMSEVSDSLRSSESSPEQRVVAHEQVGQVWKAVEGMSERRRTVFLLRYVEEMELSQIARSTGLHEGTVKAHLSRAMAKVRVELKGTK